MMDSSRWAPAGQNYDAFFAAVESGNVGRVKESLKANININLLCGDGHQGQAALHIAASSGNVELVSLLLAHGAFVDILNFEFEACSTPLHNAAFSAHVPVMRLLLDNGANVNAVGLLGGTPLHQVLYCNTPIKPEQFDAITLLLDRGADIHAAMQSTGDTIVSEIFASRFSCTSLTKRSSIKLQRTEMFKCYGSSWQEAPISIMTPSSMASALPSLALFFPERTQL